MFTDKRKILKLSIATIIILQELLKWNSNSMHNNFTTAGYRVRNKARETGQMD